LLSKVILKLVYGTELKKEEDVKAVVAGEVKTEATEVVSDEVKTAIDGEVKKPARVWINPFPQAIKDIDPLYECTAILDPPRGMNQILIISRRPLQSGTSSPSIRFYQESNVYCMRCG
jgi:hypothetical protein